MAGEAAGTRGGRGSVSGGESGASSPRSRAKFLCSHGGKILPRPTDGQLKYVGGETRVVSVSRDITFSELMKKLGAMHDGDMVLKYQLITEDLDALVSVKGDEDLKHMMDEYERQESEGSQRLRTFLFHSKPIMLESQTEHHMLEHRYIDAINGIIRCNPKMQPQQPQQITPVMAMASSPGGSCFTSACSSPKSSASPEHHALAVGDMVGHRFTLSAPMHKVHSSPSISSLQQQAYPPSHVPGRHHYHHPGYHQSSFSARAHHRGIRTPPPLSSPGRWESGSGRSIMVGGTSNYPHSGNNSPKSSLHRQSGGSSGGGYCGRCGTYDDSPAHVCNKNIDKTGSGSLPRSPR